MDDQNIQNEMISKEKLVEFVTPYYKIKIECMTYHILKEFSNMLKN